MVSLNRQRMFVGALVVVALVTSFAILHYRYLGVGTLPENEGLFHISQRHDSNNNESYSVTFQGVDFTFNYWIYPVMYYNGTAVSPTDMPYRAHFTIHFDDGVTENISIAIGGYVGLYPDAPLYSVVTEHNNPRAGVATADTYDLHGYWVLLVSL